MHVEVIPVAATATDSLWQILSAEERRRAERYRFEDDRRRSIVARGTLRLLLGRHLNRDPHTLELVAGAEGKPALRGHELEFNVSHSGDRVAIAIASGTPVGIDIERELQRMTDLRLLARRYFSSEEAELVEAARGEETDRLFFTIWTAKEAVIKAVGGGLSIELASFSVLPLQPGWRAVRNLGGDPKLDGWRVSKLAVDAGYRAAVATDVR